MPDLAPYAPAHDLHTISQIYISIQETPIPGALVVGVGATVSDSVVDAASAVELAMPEVVEAACLVRVLRPHLPGRRILVKAVVECVVEAAEVVVVVVEAAVMVVDAAVVDVESVVEVVVSKVVVVAAAVVVVESVVDVVESEVVVVVSAVVVMAAAVVEVVDCAVVVVDVCWFAQLNGESGTLHSAASSLRLRNLTRASLGSFRQMMVRRKSPDMVGTQASVLNVVQSVLLAEICR